MSEVFKRDSKAKQLAQLYGTFKSNREHATPATVNVWKEQLANIWDIFEVLHDAVINRTGQAELNTEQKTYDDTYLLYYKAKMLLGELEPPTNVGSTPDKSEEHGTGLEQLQRRHTFLIQRFEDVCETINTSIANITVSEIDIQRANLEQSRKALQDTAIERIVAADDPVTVRKVEAEMDILLVATLKLLSDTRRELNVQFNANAMGDSDQLKVPRLQITPFDGRFENWEAFRESFTHGIHSRTTMPAVQKLQYLKSVLRAEPEELIRNFGLTHENYESAWKLLNERYNNKRELIVSHLRSLTSFSMCRGSADDLRRIINKAASSLMALRNLGRPIDEWNDWIVFHICEKLDPETRRLWEQDQGSAEDVPTWEDLDKFLQGRVRALSVAGNQPQGARVQSKSKTRSHHTSSTQRSDKHSLTNSKAQNICGCCSGNHLITFCEGFRRLSPDERRGKAADKSLCFICLATGHQARQCKSTRVCQTCNAKHNTMLHLPESTVAEQQQLVQTNTASCTSKVIESPVRVLLATAIVNVRGISGEDHQMRALLDQGSESSFISERAAETLNLPRQREKVEIVGLNGAAAGRSKQSIVMCVSDRHGGGFAIQVHALIIPRVTSQLERFSIGAKHNWPHISNLVLADPDYLKSHTIDILLGSDVYGTLLQPGLRQGNGLPTAQNTSFGWILSGKVTACHASKVNELAVRTHHSISIDDQLARFWEIEETTSIRRQTADEEKCENFYDETVTRDASGRLHVRLPMKTIDIDFGESQRFALQRQLQIERKFRTNPEFAKQYREFMDQYCTLGHMREVRETKPNCIRDRTIEPSSRREYYIPHHAVIKEASTTTKLRVVFDASRRTTNGVSLNDQMMIGPRLQDDLTAIILRWRKFRIAFCADIEKMYRQIMVDEPDADLQRIVWRATTDESMRTYQLRTVTYGTASAPYLAIKSLHTLAQLERERYPTGSQIVLNNFYVDDVLAGADTARECVEHQSQLINLLSSGGFALRKWASNCDDVLAQVLPAHRECQLPLDIDDGKSINTLGVQWNPATDEITFKIEIPHDSDKCTKRSFLSAASRLYDPLGWLAPCIIIVKILFQSLWKLKLDWDDALPAELAKNWNEIRTSLHQLRNVRISRWIGITSDCDIEIHGFCDASMDAYSAVVYVRVLTGSEPPRIYNVCAKTRVAPIKVISLPRLELCGAVLLVKLIGDAINGMQLTLPKVHCWTDSTIVLAWLRGHPSRFNIFVANRTAEIQRKFPSEHWRHVISADNPADCASRGISPQQLLKHQLWWTGPHWLRGKPTNWPQQPSVLETTEETRRCVHLEKVVPPGWDLITKYSSWRRLVRVTAWCLRFIYNCRISKNERKLGVLKPDEHTNAREFWVRSVQSVAYADELRWLQRKPSISKTSSLRSLNPFLSIDNILRVGGRLQNAHVMTETARRPAIIPRNSALSALLISDAHERTLHGGPLLMLAYLRRAYWLIGGPTEVKRFVQHCTVCFRYTARPGHQQMAALPAARVIPSRPFSHCAMDYSGTIMVRTTKGRGHHATKAYVVVFVCLATKAIHIELAGDLTTTAFIAAYERFTSRRGVCSDLYSDNATNFVGASAVFMRSERQLFDNHVQTVLATKGTIWHFSPPLSPHFNGLAESAIRSVKHHIRRVIGETTLTFEELTTVLAKIESCLNSRPLCPMSSDPEDFDVLTPGHFLIGEPTNSIPQKDLSDCKTTSLTRWQLTHQMVQRFWQRWSAEYLHTLQQRHKWQSPTDNLRVGDMVLVIEDNLPPARWNIGRILEVHPGKDGRVRVVTLQIRGSTFKRAVVKLARLPIDQDPTTVPNDPSNIPQA